MPGQFLANSQRENLNFFPTTISREDLVAYFTLSDSDKAAIIKQRGEHNRLGFAIQLCALRYMGFCPDNFENIPSVLANFVAFQLDVPVNSLEKYGQRIHTRTNHFQQVQEYLGFHKALPLDLHILSKWLVQQALDHDKPTFLFKLAVEKLLRDKIVRPGVTILERMVITARQSAQTETYRQLLTFFDKERCSFLDQLLTTENNNGQTNLTWLRNRAKSNSAQEIVGAIKKVLFLKEAAIFDLDLSMINPNRLKLLAQIGKKATNQYLQRADIERRYPVLMAFLKQSLTDIIDEIIEMYDQCLWDYYSEAQDELEVLKLSLSKSKDEKLLLFKDIGEVLLNPNISDVDIRPTTFNNISQETLKEAIEDINKMVCLSKSGDIELFAKRYGYFRRFVPQFLNVLTFHSNRSNDLLLKALEIIQEADKSKTKQKIPDNSSIAFISTTKWKPYVIDEKGKINRKYYELNALWELRKEIRSGNIWVEHSQNFSNLESYLIPREKWPDMKKEICELIGAPEDVNVRLKEREIELEQLLGKVNHLLSENTETVRLENDEIIVSPIEGDARSQSVISLEKTIAQRLPRLDLADLLIEVDSWTNFSDCFKHAGGQEHKTPNLKIYLYACIIAQARNFGFDQMAQITDIPYHRLSWCNKWFIREETLRLALADIVNYHHHLPLTQCWGVGTFSSSDGQRFPVTGKVRKATALPKYYGYGKGLTYYSWTSDQLSQYGIKVIPSTVRDSTFVLDEILDNATELIIDEHTTDTAGYTELIFALFDLLGMRFSPRIRDIKDQRMYRFRSIDIIKNYPNLAHRIKAIINNEAIITWWDDFLRVAGSLKKGWATASLIVQKLQSFAQKNALTLALQEYGRILKTMHILRWYERESFRRKITNQLNKGEAIHTLRSYVRSANKGYIRRIADGEMLNNQASCLNLVTNAIVTWNTVYMAAVIDQLKSEGYPINEDDLKHLWPTRFRHINIHGKVRFNIEEELQRNGLRPLRKPELYS